MRPRYERPEDVEAERDAMRVFKRYYFKQNGIEIYAAKKPPERYRVDYMLVDRSKRLLGWVEVKSRKGASSSYDTWYVALDKVIAGIQCAKATNCNFFLIFRWDDEVFLNVVSDIPSTVEWNGRVDRDDSDDMEPVVHFPRRSFTYLGKVGDVD